jgi:hypothetical protein
VLIELKKGVDGLLDLERGTGRAWGAAELNDALAQSLSGQNVTGFRSLTDDELGRTRALRDELKRRWDALAPGGTLVVPFPVLLTQGSAR